MSARVVGQISAGVINGKRRWPESGLFLAIQQPGCLLAMELPCVQARRDLSLLWLIVGQNLDRVPH
jgi:hypothetical protein